MITVCMQMYERSSALRNSALISLVSKMKDAGGNPEAAATHTSSEAELVAFSHWINRLGIKYTGQIMAKILKLILQA